MARIDRFIPPVLKAAGARMVLAAGHKAALVTGGQSRAVTAEAATREQVEGFLKEILPADNAATLDAQGKCRFTYEAAGGSVLVNAEQTAEGLMVTLEAAGAVPAATMIAPRPPEDSTAPTPVVKPAATVAASCSPAIDPLLKRLVSEGCSDLHLSTGNPALYRKDGEIVPLGETTPVTEARMREMLFEIAEPRYRELFEEANDIDFSYEIPGLARFRCNLFMDRTGMGGVFRVIPEKIPTAETLGLSKNVLELCHMTKGLVLVTGPTGSGKSTTLASMIDYINRNINAHIITIEDPIEFVHKNQRCLVNQREVGTHTKAFKSALRAALREDPDIVLVGEMRDLETVAIAIETAETGHLVFGTLHTNTAPSTVDRVIDQFPTDRHAQVRTMLAESLKGVITQLLCRKKGGGRVAVREILLVSSAVSNLIREGKTFQIPSIMQTGRGAGMVCMNDALLELAQKEIIEPAEALAKSVNRAELKGMLTRAGIKLDTAAVAGVGA